MPAKNLRINVVLELPLYKGIGYLAKKKVYEIRKDVRLTPLDYSRL